MNWQTKQDRQTQKSIDRHNRKTEKQFFGMSNRNKYSGVVTAQIVSIHNSQIDKTKKVLSIRPVKRNRKVKRNVLFVDNDTWHISIWNKPFICAIACKRFFRIRHKHNHIVSLKEV